MMFVNNCIGKEMYNILVLFNNETVDDVVLSSYICQLQTSAMCPLTVLSKLGKHQVVPTFFFSYVPITDITCIVEYVSTGRNRELSLSSGTAQRNTRDC